MNCIRQTKFESKIYISIPQHRRQLHGCKSVKVLVYPNQKLYIIVHFLPVFGCLGESAWNFIPIVYSMVMGSSYLSDQDFSAKGLVKGVCVWGVAPETTPEAE